MTRSKLEGDVRSWLHEEGHEDADRVLFTVLDQLDTTPQRHAGWLARRFPPMNSNTIRFGIAAAAVRLIALVGFRLLPGSGVGGNGASPTPSATPSPTASPSPMASGPESLEPGVHTTSAFAVQTAFTVPAGWVKTWDRVDGFRLEPATAGVAAQFDVCRGDATAVDNENHPIPGVGDTPAEILAAVAERTDLEVSGDGGPPAGADAEPEPDA